ncbi:MAG: TIGR04283 family arsenosugar biosynthesis glycosyltransferase [Magnetococcales bacterium]|nr:TIGR04283 family arsenosugar biosynthesis glycosyltransferase [Magnetococcales bacterium]
MPVTGNQNHPPSASPFAVPTLSVIIPTLNEAAALPGLLERLRGQQGIALEVIVADGGSGDATRAVARAGGAVWVEAPRGRGSQMNAGARLARGARLLFLHADSGLPDSGLLAAALACLEQAQRRLGHRRVAGHFPLRFADANPRTLGRLRYQEAKSALDREECINGDQGLLLDGAFFRELGGFDSSLPFLEDQRLARRIFRQGSWITLPGHLVTSARRFEAEGYWRRSLLNMVIMACHHLDWEAFFLQAPAIYRTQTAAGPLRLVPFLDLAWRLDRASPWRVRVQRWRGFGRYGLESLWQVFFRLDLALGRWEPGTRRPALAFHDWLAGPLLRLPLLELPVALLLWLLVTGVGLGSAWRSRA